ncbi:hypothetical protein V6N11_006011 [Hibiscus sabdariffa]|uniref:Uncharacterized protein n=1 Tax=Hibiscus sabdariffa TaxID=183260 RepID=A0ABR2RQ02_9ROSI
MIGPKGEDFTLKLRFNPRRNAINKQERRQSYGLIDQTCFDYEHPKTRSISNGRRIRATKAPKCVTTFTRSTFRHFA